MRKVVKNYNFCDFELKVEEPNLSKTKLSVNSFANVDVYTKSIKPVSGFVDLTSSIFVGEIERIFASENFSNFADNITSEIISDAASKMLDGFENQDLLNSLIYLTAYDYFDDTHKKYKTIYFGIDKEFKLYKLLIASRYNSESNEISENGEISDKLSLELQAIFQDIVFSFLPKVFEKNGKIYFYEKHEKFLYFEKDLDPVIVSSFASILSSCDLFNQTFFIAESEPYKLFYTDKSDPENISSDLSLYEFVETDTSLGRVLKVISYKGSIFVVSDYGVSKLVTSDDKFYLTANCFLKSKISAESIFEINDYIIFVAGSKCYLFDGNEFEEIFSSEMQSIATKKSSVQELDEIETNIFTEKSQGDNLKAIVFDNRFFMLANCSYYFDKAYVASSGSEASSVEKQKMLIEFDIGSKKARFYSVSGAFDFYVIRSINSYKLVIAGESGGEKFLKEKCDNFGRLETRFVKFNSICFDDNAEKIITQIKTISSGQFTLKITSENGTKVLPVSGNLNVSALGLSGYSFDIEIYSNTDFLIKSILFSVQTITE